jgi:hypothetical protein
MQEPTVSQKEFEAGLSLLHMMSHAPSMEDLKALNVPMDIISSIEKTTSRGEISSVSAMSTSISSATNTNDSPQQQKEDKNVHVNTNGSVFLRRNTQLNSLSKELTIDELRAHFGKPIVEVAREFGICTTFLKKICRRCGIKRWPHRQIRSLTRTIEMLHQAEAKTTNVQEKIKFANQILQLEAKKQAVIENPDANGKLERVKKCVISKAAAVTVAAANETVMKNTTAKRTSKKKQNLPLPLLPSPPPSPPTTKYQEEEDFDATTSPDSSPIASSSKNMFMDFYRHVNIIKAPSSSMSDRISPSNRKVLILSKSNVKERKRSSSFSSSTRTMMQEEAE